MSKEIKTDQAPLAPAGATTDLSDAIEGAVERGPGEEVRSVRVFDDHYRCNWWVRDGAPGGPAYLDVGRIVRSKFLRATMSGEKLVIEGVRNIIAVSSGKGGVGKSTVAVNLAVSLALDGARVGLMDADVYGPNVPMMLGASDARPEVDVNKLIPIEAFGVKFMSMALLQPGDKPMIVRGPILHGLVKQFLSDVKWGELDYLIVDMPPGTGDVQLSLAQLVPVQGAVLVTTPQNVAVADVRRALRMFETVAIPVLGIVENMSYFIAPDTGNRYNIFGEGGGERLALTYHVPFLGAVPLGIEVREGGDNGVPVVVSKPDSPQAKAFRKVTEEVARQVSIEAMKPELVVLGKGQ